MRLTTYFRAMERAQEVGKFITSYHLRSGLIRRMERVEQQRKVLLNYAEKTLEEAEAKE